MGKVEGKEKRRRSSCDGPVSPETLRRFDGPEIFARGVRVGPTLSCSPRGKVRCYGNV